MTIKKPMRPKNAAPGPNAGMPGGATIADRFKLDAPVQKQAPKGTTAVFICSGSSSVLLLYIRSLPRLKIYTFDPDVTVAVAFVSS